MYEDSHLEMDYEDRYVVEDDYTEDDRYDWDRNDDSQYCPHGTFIGSWWGPDILCGWCEDGISVAEMQQIQRSQAIRNNLDLIRRYQHVVDSLNSTPPTAPFTGHLLDLVVHWLPTFGSPRSAVDAFHNLTDLLGSEAAAWEALA